MPVLPDIPNMDPEAPLSPLAQRYVHQCHALGGKPSKSITAIAATLSTATTLDLSRHFIGGIGLQALTDIIRESETLTSLNFSGNGLSNESIVFLCRAIQNHPTITSINVSNNTISLPSGRALLDLINHSPKIKAVCMDDTVIDQNLQQKMQRILKLRHAAEVREAAAAVIAGMDAAAAAGGDSMSSDATNANVNVAALRPRPPGEKPTAAAAARPPGRIGTNAVSAVAAPAPSSASLQSSQMKRLSPYEAALKEAAEKKLKRTARDAQRRAQEEESAPGRFADDIRQAKVSAPPRGDGGWAVLRLYISATPYDFASELELLHSVVIPRLNARFAAQRVSIVPFSAFHDGAMTRKKGTSELKAWEESIGGVSVGTLQVPGRGHASLDLYSAVAKSRPLFLQLLGDKIGPSDEPTSTSDSAGTPVQVREFDFAGPKAARIVMLRARALSLGAPEGLMPVLTDDPFIAYPDPTSDAVKSAVADAQGVVFPRGRTLHDHQAQAALFKAHTAHRRRVQQELPSAAVVQYSASYRGVDQEGRLLLNGLEDFMKSAESRLATAIETLFPPVPPTTAITQAPHLPEQLHAAWVARGAECLASRKNISGKLDMYAVTPSSRNMVLVTGQAGAGASTILGAFAHRCASARGGNSIVAYHSCSSPWLSPEPQEPRTVFLELSRQLLPGRVLPEQVAAEIDVVKAKQFFAQTLQERAAHVADANTTLIIILDGLDDMAPITLPCHRLRVNDVGVDEWAATATQANENATANANTTAAAAATAATAAAASGSAGPNSASATGQPSAVSTANTAGKKPATPASTAGVHPSVNMTTGVAEGKDPIALGWIPVCLPRNVRFVASAKPKSHAAKTLAARGRDSCDVLTIPDLGDNDVEPVLGRILTDSASTATAAGSVGGMSGTTAAAMISSATNSSAAAGSASESAAMQAASAAVGPVREDELAIVRQYTDAWAGQLHRYVAHFMRETPRGATRLNMLSALPPTIDGMAERVLQALEHDVGETLARDAVCLLLVAPHGLLELELRALLKQQSSAASTAVDLGVLAPKATDPSDAALINGSVFMRILRHLRPALVDAAGFLRITGMPANGLHLRLVLSCSAMRAVATERYLTEEVAARTHRTLAHHYRRHAPVGVVAGPRHKQATPSSSAPQNQQLVQVEDGITARSMSPETPSRCSTGHGTRPGTAGTAGSGKDGKASTGGAKKPSAAFDAQNAARNGPLRCAAVRELVTHLVGGGLWRQIDELAATLSFVAAAYQDGTAHIVLRQFVAAYNALDAEMQRQERLAQQEEDLRALAGDDVARLKKTDSTTTPTSVPVGPATLRAEEFESVMQRLRDFIYFIRMQNHNLVQYPHMTWQLAMACPVGSAPHRDATKYFSLTGRTLPHFITHSASASSAEAAAAALGSTASSANRGRLHKAAVNACIFAPTGLRFASASDDRTVKVCNVQGEPILTIGQSIARVKRIAYSGTSRYLAAACEDRSVFVVDATNGTLVSRPGGHQSDSTALAVSARGRYTFVGAADRTLRCFESESGREVYVGLHEQFTHYTSAFGGVYNIVPDPVREERVFATCDTYTVAWEVCPGGSGGDRTLAVQAHAVLPIASLQVVRESTYFVACIKHVETAGYAQMLKDKTDANANAGVTSDADGQQETSGGVTEEVAAELHTAMQATDAMRRVRARCADPVKICRSDNGDTVASLEIPGLGTAAFATVSPNEKIIAVSLSDGSMLLYTIDWLKIAAQDPANNPANISSTNNTGATPRPASGTPRRVNAGTPPPPSDPLQPTRHLEAFRGHPTPSLDFIKFSFDSAHIAAIGNHRQLKVWGCAGLDARPRSADDTAKEISKAKLRSANTPTDGSTALTSSAAPGSNTTTAPTTAASATAGRKRKEEKVKVGVSGQLLAVIAEADETIAEYLLDAPALAMDWTQTPVPDGAELLVGDANGKVHALELKR